jgi:hypothetical protein
MVAIMFESRLVLRILVEVTLLFMLSNVEDIDDWVDEWEELETGRLSSFVIFPAIKGPLISNFSSPFGVADVVVGRGADTVVKCVALESVVEVELTESVRTLPILSCPAPSTTWPTLSLRGLPPLGSCRLFP